MIYKFDYAGPGKTPRTAEIRVSSDDPRSLGTLAEDAYQAKYNTFPGIDGSKNWKLRTKNGRIAKMKSKPMILAAAALKTIVLFTIGAGTVGMYEMIQHRDALIILLTIGVVATGLIYLVEVSGALDKPKPIRQLYDVYDRDDRVYTYLARNKEEAADMFLSQQPYAEIMKIERGAEL